MRSACERASGPAGAAAAVKSRSASLIEPERRSISPSVNSSRVSPTRSWVRASSYTASGSSPSSTPSGSGSALAAPSRTRTGRQVPGPGPAQYPGLRVVAAADDRPGDALGEMAGGVVEVPEELGRALLGRRQPPQRVARGHHAGHRVDAVPGDVPHHDQQVVAGQGQHVVPVAADQVPGLDRAVADRDVHPRGRHRRLVLGHDGLLEAEREQVLLGRALLAVGQLVAGGGQRDLGVVLRGDVLEGAAQRDQGVVDDDRLGEDPDLPDRGVARPDDAEHRHGRLPALQQRLLEPADRRAVGRDHEAVQLGDRNRRRLVRIEPEQRERGIGPADGRRPRAAPPSRRCCRGAARGRAARRIAPPRPASAR